MAPEVQEFDFGGTMEHRVEKLIFYATRQGNSITQAMQAVADMQTRLKALEEERQRYAVERARAEERDKAVMARLEAIEKSVDGLKAVLNKAIAVIATGIGLALLNWMLSGGLRATGASLKFTWVTP